MSKRLFEILDEMNVNDDKNGTATVGVCPDFVSANKNGKKATVTIGVPYNAFIDIMNNKYKAVLLLIDMEEYRKVEQLS